MCNDWYQVLVAVLCALQTANVIALLTAQHRRSDSQLAAVSAGLSLLSYILAGALHHFSHLRSRRSSSTLLFFWLFTILTNLVTLRTQVDLHFFQSSLPTFVLSCLLLLPQIVVFASECIRPDPTSGYIRLGDDVVTKEVPFV